MQCANLTKLCTNPVEYSSLQPLKITRGLLMNNLVAYEPTLWLLCYPACYVASLWLLCCPACLLQVCDCYVVLHAMLQVFDCYVVLHAMLQVFDCYVGPACYVASLWLLFLQWFIQQLASFHSKKWVEIVNNIVLYINLMYY